MKIKNIIPILFILLLLLTLHTPPLKVSAETANVLWQQEETYINEFYSYFERKFQIIDNAGLLSNDDVETIKAMEQLQALTKKATVIIYVREENEQIHESVLSFPFHIYENYVDAEEPYSIAIVLDLCKQQVVVDEQGHRTDRWMSYEEYNELKTTATSIFNEGEYISCIRYAVETINEYSPSDEYLAKKARKDIPEEGVMTRRFKREASIFTYLTAAILSLMAAFSINLERARNTRIKDTRMKNHSINEKGVNVKIRKITHMESQKAKREINKIQIEFSEPEYLKNQKDDQ